jgi:hypothetical protein
MIVQMRMSGGFGFRIRVLSGMGWFSFWFRVGFLIL